jgi:uncharacterized Tic20 family protein
LPIILWQTKRERWPWLDAHGNNILNWMISLTIYTIVLLALTLWPLLSGSWFAVLTPGSMLMIGLLWLTLAGISIVHPIIGAMKANEGKVWRYPNAIPFIR